MPWKNAVCRIWRKTSPEIEAEYRGTAFLITNRFLITAQHVIKDCPYNELELQGEAWNIPKGIGEPILIPRSDVALLSLVDDIITPVRFLQIAAPRSVDIKSGLNVDFVGFGTDRDAIEIIPTTISSFSPTTSLEVASQSIPRGMSGGPVMVGRNVVGMTRARNIDGNKAYFDVLVPCPISFD